MLALDEDKLPALVVAFGNTNKKRRPFVKPTTILGRARTADVRLDSIEISAIHCIITRTATGLTIRDCESKCGTLVNDHPIREAELKHGDHVQVGPFLFRVDSPPVDAEVERNTQFVDAREQIDSANLKEELDQMRAVLLAREIALRNERDEFEKTRTQWHDERNVFETQLESLHQSQLKAALPGPEIAAALVELEVVKRQLVERDQQREELDQRLRSITKERNELTFELEHLRQESLQQEQASADESTSLHEDVEDIAPLKQELARQEALNFQLAEKLAELQNEITLLKRRPERQDLGLTVAPAIKDKPNGLSSSDVDCLCAQDQQLLEQLSGQSREISASAGSSGNQSADLQTQLNLQLEQYSALDQKYRGVLNKYQALVEEETKLRDQFDRLKADHETLVTSFVKVSADLQELTKTHETMKLAREKEVTQLEADVERLQGKLAELEERAFSGETSLMSSASLTKRELELESQLSDLKLQLEKIQSDSISVNPMPPEEVAEYERQLNEFRESLFQAEQGFRVEQSEFNERMSAEELAVAKQRADLAREKAALDRLRSEFKTEVERAERDPELRQRLETLHEVAKEIRAKSKQSPEQHGSLRDRIRGFMKKFES